MGADMDQNCSDEEMGSISEIPTTLHAFLERPGLGPTQVKVWKATADLCVGDPRIPVSIYAIAEATGLSPESVKSAVRRLRARAANHPESFFWPFDVHERNRPVSARRSRTKKVVPLPSSRGDDPPPMSPLAVVAGRELAQWRDLMRRQYGPGWRRRLMEASRASRGGVA